MAGGEAWSSPSLFPPAPTDTGEVEPEWDAGATPAFDVAALSTSELVHYANEIVQRPLSGAETYVKLQELVLAGQHVIWGLLGVVPTNPDGTVKALSPYKDRSHLRAETDTVIRFTRAVVNIQRIWRGVATRRKYRKMLDDLLFADEDE